MDGYMRDLKLGFIKPDPGHLLITKAGSGVLFDPEKNCLRYDRILNISDNLATIMKYRRVVHVTSGSIKSAYFEGWAENSCAAVGQVGLINEYAWPLYKYHGIRVAQLLLEDSNFSAHKKHILIRSYQDFFSRSDILPIINANDPVFIREALALPRCADNDVLAKMNALLLLGIFKRITVIFLTESPGFVTDDGATLYRVEGDCLEKVEKYCRGGSRLGHSDTGSLTKIRVIKELVDRGIDCWIIDGREQDCILRCFIGEKKFGSYFPARK